MTHKLPTAPKPVNDVEALDIELRNLGYSDYGNIRRGVLQYLSAAGYLRKPEPMDESEWIKAQPAEEYDLLKKQFSSLKTFVNTLGQQLSFYRKRDYETGEKNLADLRASLESEKTMNAQLTEELEAATSALTASRPAPKEGE